jgi:hypothetical protein
VAQSWPKNDTLTMSPSSPAAATVHVWSYSASSPVQAVSRSLSSWDEALSFTVWDPTLRRQYQ